MRFKLVIPTAAVLAVTLAAPANAQYERGYAPGYQGPGHYSPAYRTRVFHRVYEAPVIGPLFYGDGWVPEPVFDHSRTGGIDPNIRPPS